MPAKEHRVPSGSSTTAAGWVVTGAEGVVSMPSSPSVSAVAVVMPAVATVAVAIVAGGTGVGSVVGSVNIPPHPDNSQTARVKTIICDKNFFGLLGGIEMGLFNRTNININIHLTNCQIKADGNTINNLRSTGLSKAAIGMQKPKQIDYQDPHCSEHFDPNLIGY